MPSSSSTTVGGSGTGDGTASMRPTPAAAARAVVHRPVARVERVRFREAVHDALDAGRAEDAQRPLAARRPRLQVELAEIADVVGVEVREEDAADVPAVDPPQRQAVPRAGPRVDDPEAAAGEDRDARLGPRRMGHRRRGAAEQHAQRVALEQVGAPPRACGARPPGAAPGPARTAPRTRAPRRRPRAARPSCRCSHPIRRTMREIPPPELTASSSYCHTICQIMRETKSDDIRTASTPG